MGSLKINFAFHLLAFLLFEWFSFLFFPQSYDSGFGQGAGRESHGEHDQPLMVFLHIYRYQKCEFEISMSIGGMAC